MPLKAVYKTESEIPEGAVPFFKEQADGTFKLDLDGELKTQADIDRVKASLDKQRDINEDLTRKLSKVPDDFDADKWSKVKDLDPNASSGGKFDPDDEKAFNKAVSEAVREKERDIKENLESEFNKKQQELEAKEQSMLNRYKKDWIKNKLAEKHGFSDPKRLRWFMLDVDNDVLPEMKRALDSIQVIEEEGQLKVVGGDLKDPDGAYDVLDRITQKDVVKDYKPANDNSGGGAGGNGSADTATVNKLKKGDGSMNLTVASKMYQDNPEKAKSAMRQAGFDPDRYFKN